VLGRIIDSWKRRAAMRSWQKSRIGQLLAAHTREYFTKYPRLSGLSQETKDRFIEDFYANVFGIAQAQNPFLAMRERLAAYVVGLAEYQVWCLTEAEKSADALYANCPYISGLLYKNIQSAYECVEDLREVKWKHPDISADQLVDFCNTRSVIHKYYVNGFNFVRTEFDDIDPTKDWLRPFLKAMLIWEEDKARSKAKLPRLLPDGLDSLKYSTFMNMVTNGHKNPYFEWEKTWGEGRI
jgi:hypothetical protein